MFSESLECSDNCNILQKAESHIKKKDILCLLENNAVCLAEVQPTRRGNMWPPSSGSMNEAIKKPRKSRAVITVWCLAGLSLRT